MKLQYSMCSGGNTVCAPEIHSKSDSQPRLVGQSEFLELNLCCFRLVFCPEHSTDPQNREHWFLLLKLFFQFNGECFASLFLPLEWSEWWTDGTAQIKKTDFDIYLWRFQVESCHSWFSPGAQQQSGSGGQDSGTSGTDSGSSRSVSPPGDDAFYLVPEGPKPPPSVCKN